MHKVICAHLRLNSKLNVALRVDPCNSIAIIFRVCSNKNISLLHEIELENLRCAVERLPNDERLLLHLRYWCDFSQAEIARHLGVTQQSVSYQERCILRKLKKLLKN